MSKPYADWLIEKINENRFNDRDLLIRMIDWLEDNEVENFIDDEELMEGEEEDV